MRENGRKNRIFVSVKQLLSCLSRFAVVDLKRESGFWSFLIRQKEAPLYSSLMRLGEELQHRGIKTFRQNMNGNSKRTYLESLFHLKVTECTGMKSYLVKIRLLSFIASHMAALLLSPICHTLIPIKPEVQ